jgi:1-acyl-sn-glycerol-3-phosphate acyltransferase
MDPSDPQTNAERSERLRSNFEDHLAPWRRTVRYHTGRFIIGLLIRAYLRPRLVHPERWPTEPALLCLNHLSWADPFVLYAVAPVRPRLYIYGPKEADLRVGRRNRLIGWFGTAVPFEPGKTDLRPSTRRALSVLAQGRLLAIFGEGRLSEEEGLVLPINPGVAFFAIHGAVPIVPVAISGSRWLRFGKRVEIRVGMPIATTDERADRATIARLTGEVHAALDGLVVPVSESRPPGRFGRWLTDVFADRPWREEP